MLPHLVISLEDNGICLVSREGDLSHVVIHILRYLYSDI